jgi:hypothetical protein
VTQVVTFHSGFQIPYFTYTLFPEKNVFEWFITLCEKNML